MKKLSVIAFFAALGLLVSGCGDGGGSSSSGVADRPAPSAPSAPSATPSDPQNLVVGTDRDGHTTETLYKDPDSGTVAKRISELTASATGSTPPRAPSIGTIRGEAVSAPAAPEAI